MCDYCSSDPAEREAAQRFDARTADRLDELAAFYRGLASGRIKPHPTQHEWDGPKNSAKLVMRELIELL